jgi:hypothetical protein
VNVSGVIGGMTPAPKLITPLDRPGLRGVPIKEILPLRADTTDREPPAKTRPPPMLPPKPPVSALPPDESGEATEVDPNAHLAVPVGEFDHGGTLLRGEGDGSLAVGSINHAIPLFPQHRLQHHADVSVVIADENEWCGGLRACSSRAFAARPDRGRHGRCVTRVNNNARHASHGRAFAAARAPTPMESTTR